MAKWVKDKRPLLTDILDCPIEEVGPELQDEAKFIQEQYFPEATNFELDFDYEPYEDEKRLFICFKRYETEKERKERERIEENWRKKQEERDRQEYERLKQKYED